MPQPFTAFKKSLTARIVLPMLTMLVLLTGAFFFVFFPDMETTYMNRKKEVLIEVTQTAWSLLNHLWEKEQTGRITREEAQLEAIDRIRSIRYGKNRKEYFWITGMDHKMVMHPYRPDFEGMDMTRTDDVDENGEKLSVVFVRKVKASGSGFVQYQWQWKDEPGKISEKLSYVKGFKPWNWYLGTGVYLTDIQQEIASIKRKILSIISGIFLITCLLTFYIIRQAVSVEQQRLKTEKALKESKERYEELLNTLPQFVFETDIDGRFTFVNRHLVDTLGLDPADKHAKPNPDPILISEDRGRAEKNFQRILSGENLGNVEYNLVSKDGQTIPVMFHAKRILQNGIPVGIRGVGIDISAEKRAQMEQEKLEKQKRQSMKMETIGTMAGGIAHDFNNILSAIIGYSDLARSDRPDAKRKVHYINQILNAAYRARDLVKQILAFSRQDEQEIKSLELKFLVKEALNFLRASAPATIEIRSEVLTKNTAVMADATQIHQVILNLCTNAVYAMKEDGGQLSVILSEENPDMAVTMKDSPEPPASYLKLRVQDTGCGIPENLINRIFDPFFTTKKMGDGTGMGLAVVHGIIKNHNGFIEVKSDVGQGTIIDIFLPKSETAPKMSDESKRPVPSGSESILFVDDEIMIAEIGEALFKDLGYDILSTTSSKEALELFMAEPNRFDMVITDLTMPQVTGLELARKISEIRPDMPVILCTGYAERIDPEVSRESGITQIILKPILRDKMALLVRAIFDGTKTT